MMEFEAFFPDDCTLRTPSHSLVQLSQRDLEAHAMDEAGLDWAGRGGRAWAWAWERAAVSSLLWFYESPEMIASSTEREVCLQQSKHERYDKVVTSCIQ